MLALVVSRSGPGLVAVQEVPPPEPDRTETLVGVRAFSLNRGETSGTRRAADGYLPGWDSAGIVLKAAADGTGPAAGSRVVCLTRSGSWAEQVSVPFGDLAVMPDGLSFSQASALPVAGLTALRSLLLGGLLAGKRVAVTGASGGVGRFAIQLAALSGALVTAIVSHPDRGSGLAELGAVDIRTDLSGPFDLILESVGGALLASAFAAIAPFGSIVQYGGSSGEPTTLASGTFYGRPGVTYHSFNLLAHPRQPYGPDLAYLAGLAAAGTLDPQVAVERSWHDASAVMTALLDRQVAGKAVLLVD